MWVGLTVASGTFTYTTVAALPTVDPSWHVKGMADIDGLADHRSDVVFQNDNGAVVSGRWAAQAVQLFFL